MVEMQPKFHVSKDEEMMQTKVSSDKSGPQKDAVQFVKN
jgi:hypothetical protein